MGVDGTSDETPPGGPPLRRETSRLLSFSDGVFAIIITLLVLDLQPPRVERGQLLHALIEQWPAYLAYVSSYLYVAVNWLNHRAAFNRVENSGKALQWYNLGVLFSTALLPFATSVVSQAMRDGDQADQRTGVVVYGLVGVLVSVSWLGLYHYLTRHHDLLDQTVPRRFFPAERARAAIGLLGYALAILVGYLVNPLFALAIFLLLPIFYSLTSSGLYELRRLRHPHG
ncbi:putative membrane protein [Micromonospora luteifusca]|uniref:Membrane protein n=1 Tax=Micromonospora luteifusca TaxID=709860 RepID=A0ABS2LQR2_9ACTN|nr:TMEM175 family protein [Micromonospora luteifusca]MBM7490467.1 putative membrane protein [Micromonospora luteifusca]